MIESRSFFVVNLNRKKGLVIIEMDIDLEIFHFIEHHFLTISTMDQKEMKFPSRQRVKPKVIELTIKPDQAIMGLVAPREIMSFVLESIGNLDPTTTPY